MKIAVMATGGVGGYFGGRLAAAGEDVHFIARGAHLSALRSNGLQLRSANGDLHLRHVSASDDPETIGVVDIVIFAVKQYDTESAAKAIAPSLRPTTGVISLQNGMDRQERLRAILGPSHVMGGAAYIAGAAVAAPGVITHSGPLARLVFGEFDRATSRRAERFLAVCHNADIVAMLSSDISRELWKKFALLAAFSGVGSLIRKPIGAIIGDPDTRQLFATAVAEAATVAAAKGMALGADYVAQQMALADSLAPETKSSMQMDVEHGRRLELDWMSGAVARFGDDYGVPTPIHHFITAALKLHANGSGTPDRRLL
jgi:2-dehydropantoate 2-reductase